MVVGFALMLRLLFNDSISLVYFSIFSCVCRFSFIPRGTRTPKIYSKDVELSA